MSGEGDQSGRGLSTGPYATLPAMAATEGRPARVGTYESLRAAVSSRRLAAVTLQSFSSGLPLGLVWIALPAFLAYHGTNIRAIGLFSLAQAPWTFKFLWAPAMDRYGPRFLGRKRSWMIVTELLLLLGIGSLAFEAADPHVAVVAALALFVAFCSASQDIAIDGYAVEVLERSEQGTAVGARTAVYRAALLVSGALAITIGQRVGWGVVFLGLGLLFVPLAGVVVWSPEPPFVSRAPRTLREAVFEPMLDIFRRSRALDILGFLLLFKFGENLATALTRPFLIQKCFSPEDVGLATATIGLVAVIAGTFFGGWSADRIGLARALWIFGLIQSVGFLGYVLVDRLAPGTPCAAGPIPALAPALGTRLVMYTAVGVENLCQAMATGAFGVLLLRLTQKQFSSTQYALFSSVFALGRTLAGPPAGFLTDALGWTPLFFVSVLASIPGLLLLQRFAPWGAEEPDLEATERIARRPVSRGRLLLTSSAVGLAGLTAAAAVSALLAAFKAARAAPGTALFFGRELERLLAPSAASGWLRLAGLLVVGVLCALGAAALTAARRGVTGGSAASRPR